LMKGIEKVALQKILAEINSKLEINVKTDFDFAQSDRHPESRVLGKGCLLFRFFTFLS
jgi:hypothetical protein